MSDEIITSRQNSRIKNAAKLRERREREQQRRFLIDGARELRRAMEAGFPLEEVFVCQTLCESEDSRQVLAQLHDVQQSQGTSVSHVSPEVFAKLAFGQRAEGVVAVARVPHHTLTDLRLPDRPLVAVLEGVEKPGNVGAVLRSADTAGVAALVLTGKGTDLYNPNTIRASLGTIFTQATCTATTDETLAWLRENGLVLYAARPDAKVLYTEVDFRGGAAIVLGTEATGLSSIWTRAEITPIRLPTLGVADSLNVSAAAAVLFYEALRQRQQNA